MQEKLIESIQGSIRRLHLAFESRRNHGGSLFFLAIQLQECYVKVDVLEELFDEDFGYYSRILNTRLEYPEIDRELRQMV